MLVSLQSDQAMSVLKECDYQIKLWARHFGFESTNSAAEHDRNRISLSLNLSISLILYLLSLISIFFSLPSFFSLQHRQPPRTSLATAPWFQWPLNGRVVPEAAVELRSGAAWNTSRVGISDLALASQPGEAAVAMKSTGTSSLPALKPNLYYPFLPNYIQVTFQIAKASDLSGKKVHIL